MPVPVLAKLAGQGRHPWTGVSPPGCHDGAMPARPATIDDIPEVLRLAALMHLTIGQRADEDWFHQAGRLLETRMAEGRTGVFVADTRKPGRVGPRRGPVT